MASKGALVVRFIGDTKDLDRSFKRSTGLIGRFGKGAIGFTSLTAAAAGFIKIGAPYVASLNKIQALSGTTDARMKDVAKTLESQSGQFAKMGQTTGDAAGGMVELIKAGMGVKAAMKAVSSTMVLAKAGEISVADAASLTSNTLNVFKMKASEAAKVANVLANAANVSSADVSDLRQALAMAGNVAAGSGASLKQTAAMLAMLSNAGMQGSDAGTSLKTMLLSLQAPSSRAAAGLKELGINVFSATGQMRPIGRVLADTTKELANLTDQERAAKLKQIFGADAFRAAKVIFGNGSAELRKYVKAVDKAGAAQNLAESSSRGLAGTLSRLKAETQSTAQAAYRELSPSLDDLAKKVADFVSGMRNGTGAGGDFADVLKDVRDVGKGVLSFVNAIPGPVKKFGVQALAAVVALRQLSAISSSLGASMASPIARTKQFYAELTYAETRMQKAKMAAGAMGAALRQAAGAGGMIAMAKSAGKADTAVGALGMTAGAALTGFAVGGPIGAAIGAGAGGLFSLYKAATQAGKSAKSSTPAWKSYASTLEGVGAAAKRATRELLLQRLEESGLLAKTRELGIADRVAIQATMGNEAARKRLTVALAQAREAGKSYLALNIANRLNIEAGSIRQSRIEQLRKNLALAATKEEAQRIQNKLDRLAKTDARATVRLDGAGNVIRQLTAVQGLIRDITRPRGGNAQVPGAGSVLGIISGSRASGGPVMAGNIYRINENGPEFFRPFTSGQVMTGTSVQKAATGVASVAPSGGDQVVEVHLHLEGETIVKQVKARNRRKGVPSAGI